MKAMCPKCGSQYDVEGAGKYECPQCNCFFVVEPPKKRIVVTRKPPVSTPTPPAVISPHKRSNLGLVFLLLILASCLIVGGVAFFHIQKVREATRINTLKQASFIHLVASDALRDFKRLGYRSQYEFREAYDSIQHEMTQRLGLPELYQREVRPIVVQVCGILPPHRDELASSTGEAWACFGVRSYGGRGGGNVGATVDVSSYTQKGIKIADEVIKPIRAEIERQFMLVLKNCETVIRKNSSQ